MTGTIVLFNLNLRLHDNVPLHTAAANGPVIPVYIYDNTIKTRWPLGGASKWWLHQSLNALANDLNAIGSKLIIREGNSYLVLKELIQQTGYKDIYFEHSILPEASIPEDRLYKLCKRFGGEARRFRGQTLFHPSQIHTKDQTPYKVFTPFWNSCLKHEAIPTPLPIPHLQAPENWPDNIPLEDLKLLPTDFDWTNSLDKCWQAGETQARKALDQFVSENIDQYDNDRDIPSLKHGTSKLSPHLHFGEISPITVWHQVKNAIDLSPSKDRGGKVFLKELGWREFSYHLLYHFNDLDQAPLNKTFQHFPWVKDTGSLTAWQKGQTGYPIIDAGMRELWQTGWMHNRVRMIVASFLVKNLRIHWLEGAKWFWDTLVDADLASNSASWQWVAGCGAEVAPYFRIFNPTLQSKKFDPDGEYIRRYVPELKKMPDKHIHEPWTANQDILESAGIKLGKTYPRPIADHKATREEALIAYQQLKSSKALVS
ncbi:deoxyribodipyrimidine photo-lyase [Kordiimonas sp. SCSIO 12610]|uniref:cryptochrome/photolyase family protein n=1 Tax=Kordiimonas sp. SCSIO 12610 TaxID=2829597 RepID=UPI00210E3D83|nr:deoxyribodipyrimidine photo-lyase [Kordiimonas sp. SCSIO 12610]UTW55075.1 deoxyribodipyrimidine photo-lyase [Kordiimonas sp. SCSIO 12610]